MTFSPGVRIWGGEKYCITHNSGWAVRELVLYPSWQQWLTYTVEIAKLSGVFSPSHMAALLVPCLSSLWRQTAPWPSRWTGVRGSRSCGSQCVNSSTQSSTSYTADMEPAGQDTLANNTNRITLQALPRTSTSGDFRCSLSVECKEHKKMFFHTKFYFPTWLSAGLNNSIKPTALGNKALPGCEKTSGPKLAKGQLENYPGFFPFTFNFVFLGDEGNFHVREANMSSAAKD